MPSWLAKPCLWSVLALLSGSACAAPELGLVTLVDGGARFLRGVTWYKLTPGIRVEEGDILDAPERAQLQVEFTSGTAVNLTGPGQLYATPTKGSAVTFVLPDGWIKIAAKSPGVTMRMEPIDIVVSEGVAVVHAKDEAVELFVEEGRVRLVELTSQNTEKSGREARRGTYWSKSGSDAFTTVPRAPPSFVAAMPRHYYDPLPALKSRIRTKPPLVAERDINYAEAQPWLAGPDRRTFERRFTSRLRDPEFRRAVEPHITRYPRWDRMLHPEKYEPRPAAGK
jgi:hypothetical protein